MNPLEGFWGIRRLQKESRSLKGASLIRTRRLGHLFGGPCSMLEAVAGRLVCPLFPSCAQAFCFLNCGHRLSDCCSSSVFRRVWPFDPVAPVEPRQYGSSACPVSPVPPLLRMYTRLVEWRHLSNCVPK